MLLRDPAAAWNRPQEEWEPWQWAALGQPARPKPQAGGKQSPPAARGGAKGRSGGGSSALSITAPDAFWRLTSNGNDAAAGAANLTNTGSVSFGSGGATFNGSNRLGIANVTGSVLVPTATTSFTVGLEVVLASTANQFLATVGSAAFTEWSVNLWGGNLVLWLRNIDFTVSTTPPSTSSRKRILAWVDDNTSANIQVEGTAAATSTGAGATLSNTGACLFDIGRRADDAFYVPNGTVIGFVSFWRSVLPAGERTTWLGNQGSYFNGTIWTL